MPMLGISIDKIRKNPEVTPLIFIFRKVGGCNFVPVVLGWAELKRRPMWTSAELSG